MRIEFDKNISQNIIRGNGFAENCHCKISEYKWIMGVDGLYSESWNAEFRASKKIELADVKTLNLEGNLSVDIKYGKDRSVELKGKKKDFENLEHIVTDNAATLVFDNKYGKHFKVIITTPSIDHITAKNVKNMTIDGFTQEKMEVLYHSRGELKIYADINYLSTEIDGYAKATFIGSGKKLDIKSNSSRIDAEKYMTEVTNVVGHIRDNSSIHASEEASYERDMEYRLRVFGSPKETIIEE